MFSPGPDSPEANDVGASAGARSAAQDSGTAPRIFSGKVTIEGAKPIAITTGQETAPKVDPRLRERSEPIALALKEYQRAARALLEGKYSHLIDAAPAHMRTPSDCWVVLCEDGVVVRWEGAAQADPKVRMVFEWDGAQPKVESVVPKLSQGVVYCSADPTNFVHPGDGQCLQFGRVDPATGQMTLVFDGFMGVVVPWDSHLHQPGSDTPVSRPVPVVSVANEFMVQMLGEMFDGPAESTPGAGRQFVAVGHFELPVGWHAIEVFPPYEPALWRAEIAPMWAELDLLAVVTTRNVLDRQFQELDPHAAARNVIAARLREADELLHGLEAPVQAFLQKNPELIVPAYKRVWPKLTFGKSVTDFVFEEQPGEYLLVEIEAPVRKLFRKDGQEHENLVHAKKQVMDWWRYIGDNLTTVRHELGLGGISAQPPALIVIGRSETLRPEDRRMLKLWNDTNPKMRVITYDDLMTHARAVATNLLGPLWSTDGSAKVYLLPAAK
jgi:Domain of unknown function (DUF4263)